MRTILLSATASFLLMVGAAQAAPLKFSATLDGASEVPANTEAGRGTLSATLDPDTKLFSYAVSYSGLTGPGLMAHFHGPAAPGANAPPVIAAPSVASPIEGKATLTDAQIADLEAGKWYFNIHTAAHKGGEIRGQVTAAK